MKSAAGAGALAAAGGFSAPAISQRVAARALRLVPEADLANFDPIWNTQYIVRNAALLVWDMLYGVDAQLQAHRQMVEAEEVSADGLTWTFRLRPELKFHDGEPVLARDVVASIKRWHARDNMGLMSARDRERARRDRRPHVPLGSEEAVSGNCCWRLARSAPHLFIMPARIAATDPFKPISEYIGSGPMRLRAE